MKNFTPFLFVLISVAVAICVLSCLGCSFKHESQTDKILRVGDKLPPFTFSDLAGSNYGISWTGGKEYTVSGRVYGPGVITLPRKKAWIELKNGTRYMCLTDGGCRISSINFTIIEGEIKTSYSTKR